MEIQLPEVDWPLVSEMIQVIGAIGTFLAALVGYLTLRILVKQRRDSFRPNVVLGNTSFGTCYSKDTTLRSKWRNDSEDNVTFKLLNAGNGIAINLVVSVDWSVEDAIKYVKERDFDNEFRLSLSNDDLEIRTTFDKTYIFTHVGDTRTLGTLLTLSNSDNKPNTYVFPDPYLMLLSCLSYLLGRHASLKFLQLDEYPPLIYKIAYDDVEGKRYEANYVQTVFKITPESYIFHMVRR